ncbi:MAG: hypothetical protein MHM6MM_004945 [Cercozoa sp. M6MM]
MDVIPRFEPRSLVVRSGDLTLSDEDEEFARFDAEENRSVELTIPLNAHLTLSTKEVITTGVCSASFFVESITDAKHTTLSLGLTSVACDDDFLYGFRSDGKKVRQVRTADGKKTMEALNFSHPWGAGDVIRVKYDHKNGTMEYFRNGDFLGVAFVDVRGAYRFSLLFKGGSARVVVIPATETKETLARLSKSVDWILRGDSLSLTDAPVAWFQHAFKDLGSDGVDRRAKSCANLSLTEATSRVAEARCFGVQFWWLLYRMVRGNKRNAEYLCHDEFAFRTIIKAWLRTNKQHDGLRGALGDIERFLIWRVAREVIAFVNPTCDRIQDVNVNMWLSSCVENGVFQRSEAVGLVRTLMEVDEWKHNFVSFFKESCATFQGPQSSPETRNTALLALLVHGDCPDDFRIGARVRHLTSLEEGVVVKLERDKQLVTLDVGSTVPMAECTVRTSVELDVPALFGKQLPSKKSDEVGRRASLMRTSIQEEMDYGIVAQTLSYIPRLISHLKEYPEEALWTVAAVGCVANLIHVFPRTFVPLLCEISSIDTTNKQLSPFQTRRIIAQSPSRPGVSLVTDDRSICSHSSSLEYREVLSMCKRAKAALDEIGDSHPRDLVRLFNVSGESLLDEKRVQLIATKFFFRQGYCIALRESRLEETSTDVTVYHCDQLRTAKPIATLLVPRAPRDIVDFVVADSQCIRCVALDTSGDIWLGWRRSPELPTFGVTCVFSDDHKVEDARFIAFSRSKDLLLCANVKGKLCAVSLSATNLGIVQPLHSLRARHEIQCFGFDVTEEHVVWIDQNGVVFSTEFAALAGSGAEVHANLVLPSNLMEESGSRCWIRNGAARRGEEYFILQGDTAIELEFPKDAKFVALLPRISNDNHGSKPIFIGPTTEKTFQEYFVPFTAGEWLDSTASGAGFENVNILQNDEDPALLVAVCEEVGAGRPRTQSRRSRSRVSAAKLEQYRIVRQHLTHLGADRRIFNLEGLVQSVHDSPRTLIHAATCTSLIPSLLESSDGFKGANVPDDPEKLRQAWEEIVGVGADGEILRALQELDANRVLSHVSERTSSSVYISANAQSAFGASSMTSEIPDTDYTFESNLVDCMSQIARKGLVRVLTAKLIQDLIRKGHFSPLIQLIVRDGDPDVVEELRNKLISALEVQADSLTCTPESSSVSSSESLDRRVDESVSLAKTLSAECYFHLIYSAASHSAGTPSKATSVANCPDAVVGLWILDVLERFNSKLVEVAKVAPLLVDSLLTQAQAVAYTRVRDVEELKTLVAQSQVRLRTISRLLLQESTMRMINPQLALNLFQFLGRLGKDIVSQIPLNSSNMPENERLRVQLCCDVYRAVAEISSVISQRIMGIARDATQEQTANLLEHVASPDANWTVTLSAFTAALLSWDTNATFPPIFEELVRHKYSTRGAWDETWIERMREHFVSKEMDADLVLLLNKHFASSSNPFEDYHARFEVKPNEVSSVRSLDSVPMEAIYARVAMIMTINELFHSVVFPLIDWRLDAEDSVLLRTVLKSNELLLLLIKRSILAVSLRNTRGRSDYRPCTVVLDRFRAMKLMNRQVPDTKMKNSTFAQIWRQVSRNDCDDFRVTENNRPWRVTFLGEYSDDMGGPYREHLEDICKELMSPVLPLLQLAPNGVNNVGQNRDRFVLGAPECTPLQIRLYEFLGQLFGIALRSTHILNLNIAEAMWKAILQHPLSREDVKAYNLLRFKILEDIDREHPEYFDLAFTSPSCGGEEVELISGGKNETVVADTFALFEELYESFALSEFETHAAAIRRGFATVVPFGPLRLLRAQELEAAVCGAPTIDIIQLRAMSHVENGHEGEHSVQMLWNILSRRFNDEQRAQFLRFVWGRSRLPADPTTSCDKFKIHLMSKRDPNAWLPVSHTWYV